ncbi:hypothetical protein RUM44_012225 [Polyplax serrata]|uniref:Nuclear pore complex protein Nup88 n=1 Tax=Polyplax serrata TaxID=468196 RepID=A0ABR1BAP5_POLSC
MSDNTLRVYKVPVASSNDEFMEDPELVHVWTLGQHSMDGTGAVWNLRGNKVPFLVGLGELAVDFDFGLAVMATPLISKMDEEQENSGDESKTKLVWPVIVLRGNGDICYLNTSVTSTQKPKFEGPLPMYPSADDNYGVEACSILVLETVPSVIVLATSSGTLYHSVLLEIEQSEKSVIPNACHALYVMECVELELGIHLNDDDSAYTCPVVLHKDPVCRWKYYSTHNTGIHAVSLSFVSHIEKFFDNPSPENFRFDHPSTVEYLVCTRTNSTPVLPVLGFTLIVSTNTILSLLANGDVISLPLKISENLIHPDLLPEEVVSEESTPMKKLLQEPFDVHIRSILKRNINQPLMKLDKNVNLSPQESLDLISRTTNILRKEYFEKFQLVRDETEQRVMALRALLGLHMDELNQLDNEKTQLQAMAEKLAEKYEEITEKQLVLNQRIEKVVSTVLQLEPIESLAERKMKNEILAVEGKVSYFEKSISRLKKQMEYQKYKKAERIRDKQRRIQLGGNQVEMIKTNLNKTSQEIADLVKVINSMKQQLNISDA